MSTSYLNNLFGPVSREVPWDASDMLQWFAESAPVYIGDVPGGIKRGLYQRGVAVDTSESIDRYTYFGYLSSEKAATPFFSNAFFQPQGLKNTSGLLENVFGKKYQIEYSGIVEDEVNITTLQFVPKTNSLEAVGDTFLLGLSSAERQRLIDLKTATEPGLDGAILNDNIILSTQGDLTDDNNRPYKKYALGLKFQAIDDTMIGSGSPTSDTHIVFPSPENEVIVYSKDNLIFTSKAYSDLEKLAPYERNHEERVGVSSISDTFSINSVDLNKNKILVPNNDVSGVKINKKKLTDILVSNDKIIITGSNNKNNDGEYTIESIYTDAVGEFVNIRLTSSLKSGTNTGFIEFTKSYEDYFIDLDRLGNVELFDKDGTTVIATTQEFRSIINNFTASVNSAASKTAIESAIDTYGVALLNRGRAFVRHKAGSSTDANPDDRPLYWSRNKMSYILKFRIYELANSVPEIKYAINELVERFEDKSRGYSGIDFSGTPSGAKKVLITGFDPFFLNKNKGGNILQSNPSGANALYLHNKTLIQGVNTFLVQTVLFPVRYEDFDKGVVENTLTKFIDTSLADFKVDFIFTMSQGSIFRFDVDRFAAKNRGGSADNLNVGSMVVDSGFNKNIGNGKEFYETTLPSNKIVPINNNDNDKFFIHLNQTFEYEIAGEEVNKYNDNTLQEGFALIPDSANPLPPTSVNLAIIKESVKGSGSNYLSNEIFYRVCRIREEIATNRGKGEVDELSSGHLHLPLMQYQVALTPISYKHRRTTATNNPSTTIDFSPVNTLEMIAKIKSILINLS